jgi:hypothetical protein
VRLKKKKKKKKNITHQAIEAQKLQERESRAQIPEKGTDSIRWDHN